jgi:hypothetical protein
MSTYENNEPWVASDRGAQRPANEQHPEQQHEEQPEPTPRSPSNWSRSLRTFYSQFQPGTGDTSLSATFDAMIKRPGEISYGLLESKTPQLKMFLMIIFLLCSAGYGIIMGSFSGGNQFWSAPLRFTTGWLLSALICLPSLHIFSSLSGGRQSFNESASLLLQSMTLNAIILIGFAPVAWIFSQSTDGIAFMGTIHLTAWLIGAFFAKSLISNCMRVYNGEGGFIALWSGIYILVALQMSTTLRPLVDVYEPVAWNEKLFFIKHWSGIP